MDTINACTVPYELIFNLLLIQGYFLEASMKKFADGNKFHFDRDIFCHMSGRR
jgi:hypothetical protein